MKGVDTWWTGHEASHHSMALRLLERLLDLESA